MSRVRLIYARDPRFPTGGAEIRVQQLLKGLAQEFDCQLEVPPRSPTHRSATIERLAGAAWGVPPRLSQAFTRQARRSLADHVDQYDLPVACTTFTLPLLPKVMMNKAILDAHNLEWRIVEQLSHHAPSRTRRLAYRATKSWTRRYEARVSAEVRGVWATSPIEFDWFVAQNARVWLVPNGVELPQESSLTGVGVAPNLLFVGSLNSGFNADGLRWFLDAVWPAVRLKVPSCTLTIVGPGPRLRYGSGVAQVGAVDDLAPYYSQARACIVPLLGGAGSRLKVPEAMAHGRPVVSTSVGAEGHAVSEKDGVKLADDPIAFAESCASLLADHGLATALGTRARESAKAYAWEHSAAVARDSVRELLAESSP